MGAKPQPLRELVEYVFITKERKGKKQLLPGAPRPKKKKKKKSLQTTTDCTSDKAHPDPGEAVGWEEETGLQEAAWGGGRGTAGTQYAPAAWDLCVCMRGVPGAQGSCSQGGRSLGSHSQCAPAGPLSYSGDP